MAEALVSGAAGFIGSHLLEYLQDRGDRALAMVRKPSDLTSLTDRNVDFRHGSGGDVDSFIRCGE